jgi:hypothetical protein
VQRSSGTAEATGLCHCRKVLKSCQVHDVLLVFFADNSYLKKASLDARNYADNYLN